MDGMMTCGGKGLVEQQRQRRIQWKRRASGWVQGCRLLSWFLKVHGKLVLFVVIGYRKFRHGRDVKNHECLQNGTDFEKSR